MGEDTNTSGSWVASQPSIGKYTIYKWGPTRLVGVILSPLLSSAQLPGCFRFSSSCYLNWHNSWAISSLLQPLRYLGSCCLPRFPSCFTAAVAPRTLQQPLPSMVPELLCNICSHYQNHYRPLFHHAEVRKCSLHLC